MKLYSRRSFRFIACFLFCAAQLQFSAWSAPLLTPYAQKGKLEIKNVSGASATVAQYQKLELRVDLSATYDNPFDPADVALDARVQAPSGNTLSVPGFLYRPHRRHRD